LQHAARPSPQARPQRLTQAQPQPQAEPRRRAPRQPRQPRAPRVRQPIIYENDDDTWDKFNNIKLSNVKSNTFRTAKPNYQFPISNNFINVSKAHDIERDIKLTKPQTLLNKNK
jgi:hypothetical protein